MISQTSLSTLISFGDYSYGNSAGVVTFSTTLGANLKNAYFLKMISAGTDASIINYSDRFTLASMTGVFPTSVEDGLDTLNGTSGPPTETCLYVRLLSVRYVFVKLIEEGFDHLFSRSNKQ